MSGECDRCGEHTMDCSCNGKLCQPSIFHDEVNPSHYMGNSFEVIDIIEDFKLNYNLGNVIKYILRCNKKGVKTTDLKKAIWYIERELKICC